MGPYKLPSSGKAIADLTVLSTVNKSRKPRFELHLKICDLNNVPLANGVSYVKWHFPHSIHSEHRGRTSKRPVVNHRVEYNYAKTVPLRLVIDRSGRLADYPIEFEVAQEFTSSNNGRDEKIVLGKVTLNLAEYVAESEAVLRDETSAYYYMSSDPSGHIRSRSSMSTRGMSAGPAAEDSLLSMSPSTTTGSLPPPPPSSTADSSASAPVVEDGVIRRYLLQDSKINSTLKLSVLMIQTDGDHNFIAPPLTSAPVFGGIAGILASREIMGGGVVSLDDDGDDIAGSVNSRSMGKGRDLLEAQDVYRRALAASWAGDETELPADECIEDIFSGGDGFGHPLDSPLEDEFRAPRFSRRNQTALPSTTSLTSVMEDQDHGGEDSSITGGSGGSLGPPKKSSRLMKIPLRRKNHNQNASAAVGAVDSQPLRKSSGGSALSIPRSVTRGRPTVEFETGSAGNNSSNSNSSSGDDDSFATSSSSGSHGRSSARARLAHAAASPSEEPCFEPNATLRPRDFRHIQPLRPGALAPLSASVPHLLGMRQHGREDSVLSDRTVKATGAMGGPWSAKNSPLSPPDMASLLHRGNSSSSRNSGASSRSRASRGVRSPAGPGSIAASEDSSSRSGPRDGHRSAAESARRARHEVSEYDVRDNFVAWHLPSSSSVTAS